jgi:hypothetical protein
MKITFCLDWLKPKDPASRAFKSIHALALFTDYAERIKPFSPCAVVGTAGPAVSLPRGAKIWICDRGSGSKILSSEDVARNMDRLMDSGAKELRIYIGGPDGFSEPRLEVLKPELKWSFGPMTYPHELAAIVAAEQIYRGFTILKNLPYHTMH